MTPPAPRLVDLPHATAVGRVAGPVVGVGLLRGAFYVVDTWWVGHLGGEALVAVAAASFAWWIVEQLCDLGAVGIHARVARDEGAERDGRADWLFHGLVVGAVVWALLVGTAPWSLPAYLDAVGLTSPAARSGAQAYLDAMVTGAGAAVLGRAVEAVYRGVGDTRTALGLTAAALAANALLDPVLIWGWGPLPALGIAGAAWATLAASALSGLLGGIVLWRRGGLGAPVRWAPDRLAELVRIGLPVTISGVGFSLVYVVLGRMITHFGDAPMAALGIGHRLESFCFLAAIGFMVGASTMVGQHLGTGRPDRARAAAATAGRVAALAMLPPTVVAVVFAEPVYGLFTDDPAIVAEGVVYLRIQALVWVFMAWELVYEGAFAGAGRTVPAMWIGALGTAARIPLAAALAWGLSWGVTGIWVAVAVSTLTKGLILRVAFARLDLPESRADVEDSPTVGVASPASVEPGAL